MSNNAPIREKSAKGSFMSLSEQRSEITRIDKALAQAVASRSRCDLPIPGSPENSNDPPSRFAVLVSSEWMLCSCWSLPTVDEMSVPEGIT
jgi:hypothetical protein